MNWTTVFILALFLILADKTLTVMNIKAVQRNTPNADILSIEKNPIAKKMFEKFGLYGGSVVMVFISLATFYFALWLFSYPASYYAPENSYGVALYFMTIFYGLVIFNNLYFFLRYSKLL